MEYCLSDIHGHYSLFCLLLDKIKFGGGDKIYVLGDIIDKGPESVRLAKLLFSMPDAVCIAGNHEYDFLKYYRALLGQTSDYDEVLRTLQNYFTDGDLLDWDTVDRLDALPFYVERKKWIGVHAGIPVLPDGSLLPFERATPEQLVYDRKFKEPDVLPRGKCVLFGHTPVRYLTGKDEILFYPRTGSLRGSGNVADYCKIHLDMMTYQSGVLGCVALDTCQCFYVGEDRFLR